MSSVVEAVVPAIYDAKRDLRVVSAAERLILWRYRQRTLSGREKGRVGSAMSQPEAAVRLGVGRSAYRRLESGGRVKLGATEMVALGTVATSIEPTTGELCYLARRRSKRLLMGIERELGVSRPTLYEMERAGHPAVVKMWEHAGYVFPEA